MNSTNIKNSKHISYRNNTTATSGTVSFSNYRLKHDTTFVDKPWVKDAQAVQSIVVPARSIITILVSKFNTGNCAELRYTKDGQTFYHRIVNKEHIQQLINTIYNPCFEKLLYPPTVFSFNDPAHPDGVSVPYECYNMHKNDPIGKVIRQDVGAPGIGYTEYEITRIDETGIYAICTKNTVRIGDMSDFM